MTDDFSKSFGIEINISKFEITVIGVMKGDHVAVYGLMSNDLTSAVNFPNNKSL